MKSLIVYFTMIVFVLAGCGSTQGTEKTATLQEIGACEELSTSFAEFDTAYQSFLARRTVYQTGPSLNVSEDVYLANDYQVLKAKISNLISGKLSTAVKDPNIEELARIALNQVLILGKTAYLYSNPGGFGGNISGGFMGASDDLRRQVGVVLNDYCR